MKIINTCLRFKKYKFKNEDVKVQFFYYSQMLQCQSNVLAQIYPYLSLQNYNNWYCSHISKVKANIAKNSRFLIKILLLFSAF